MKSNHLILFTADFPFGHSETFLETEISVLSDLFGKIDIVSFSELATSSREVPANVSVTNIKMPSGLVFKLLSMRYFFSKLFWKEISKVKNSYEQKVTKQVLTTALISIANASFIRRKSIPSFRSEETVFYSYWSSDVALSLTMLKRRHNIKAISRAHRWDLYFEASPINYLPYRSVLSDFLDEIHVISETGKAYIEKNWKVPTKNVSVSYLGVAEGRSTISDKIRIVSCSNVIEVKRLHLIVAALSKIKSQEIEWVHFGDGDLLKSVKKQSEQLLPSNINVIWKGNVSNQQVLEFYKAHGSTLFINVSSSEGIPVSIMEAMAHSIPVIATDVGATREIVNDTNGILLNSNPTIAEIAESILGLIQSQEYKMYRRNAFDMWKSKFDAKENYTKFGRSLLRLIDQN